VIQAKSRQNEISVRTGLQYIEAVVKIKRIELVWRAKATGLKNKNRAHIDLDVKNIESAVQWVVDLGGTKLDEISSFLPSLKQSAWYSYEGEFTHFWLPDENLSWITAKI
jgi:hypothetical protein